MRLAITDELRIPVLNQDLMDFDGMNVIND